MRDRIDEVIGGMEPMVAAFSRTALGRGRARRTAMHRFVALVAASLLALGLVAARPDHARGDTVPTISSVVPATIASGSPATLEIHGDGFGVGALVRWRGLLMTTSGLDDGSPPGSGLSVTLPASALTIASSFETDELSVIGSSVATSDGYVFGPESDPVAITVVGPAVGGAASAIADGGTTVQVATAHLSVRYTRAAGADRGTVTAVDYLSPRDRTQVGDPYVPPNPIQPISLGDIRLGAPWAGDSLVATFVPPNPILPPNPIIPVDSYVPPNPIRLAWWTGTAWAPVIGSGGVTPAPIFDRLTTSASAVAVTFDGTSSPQVTELGGTVFALIAAYAFDGFAAPLDPGVRNVAKAGRAIPLKWRVLDLGGSPVSDLDAGSVVVSSVRIDCATVAGQDDPVEAYATASSGLQNLGKGSYQWNWASDKAWAGTCRRLRLDLGDRTPAGDPILRTADFEFVR